MYFHTTCLFSSSNWSNRLNILQKQLYNTRENIKARKATAEWASWPNSYVWQHQPCCRLTWNVTSGNDHDRPHWLAGWWVVGTARRLISRQDRWTWPWVTMSRARGPVGWLVGCWMGHPRWSWLGGRVVGMDGLAAMSLGLFKMAKRSWWDAAASALPSFHCFLLGTDTSLVEPVKLSWETKCSVRKLRLT